MKPQRKENISNSSENSRKELLYILFVSIAIDVLAALVETPFIIELFGVPVVLDEILEMIISYLLSRNRIKLSVVDYLAGMLPVPGVTAVSFYAFRKFFFGKRDK